MLYLHLICLLVLMLCDLMSSKHGLERTTNEHE